MSVTEALAELIQNRALTPCKVATTANITLSGLQTIDGVSLIGGERVLVKNQNDPTENGIWLVSASAWSRSSDFNDAQDIVSGAVVAVWAGTLYTNTIWQVSFSGEPVFGATEFVFTVAATIGLDADQIANIEAVEDIDAEIVVVATRIDDVTAVAGIANEVGIVADAVEGTTDLAAAVSGAESAASSAAASATQAISAAATSSAAASATSEAIGATIYDTKSDADTALSGLDDGTYVQVLVDETKGNQRTLYEVEGSAYVFIRSLGDLTEADAASFYGRRGNLRTWTAVLASMDQERFNRNYSNPTYDFNEIPRSLTGSLSGTTFTAASTPIANLNAIYQADVHRVLVGDDGTELLIVPQDLATNPDQECEVLQSGTVSSQTWIKRAKSPCVLFNGDSIAWETFAGIFRDMYRAMGYGGAYRIPTFTESKNEYPVVIDLNGSAAEVRGSAYTTYPFGTYWTVPSGSSINVSHRDRFKSDENVFNRNNMGLRPDQMKTDTLRIIWRRAAGGAFTVSGKRKGDYAYEVLETVADASSGSRTFEYLDITHERGADWKFEIACTSGTFEPIMLAMLDRSQPGLILCPQNRGSDDIDNFDSISTSDYSEIMELVMPDLIVWQSWDPNVAHDFSDYVDEINEGVTFWNTVSSRADMFLIASQQDPTTQQDDSDLRNEALRHVAIVNDFGFLDLRRYLGTASEMIEHGAAPGVHLNDRGEIEAGILLEQLTGWLSAPTLWEGRNIRSKYADHDQITLNGHDLQSKIDPEKEITKPQRQLCTPTSNARYMLTRGLTAIGTNGLTIAFEGVFDGSGLVYIFQLADGLTNAGLSENGALTMYFNGVDFYTRIVDGSGDTMTYRMNDVLEGHQNEHAKFVIKTNRTKDQFEIWINGERLEGITHATPSGSGDDLTAWSGTSTEAKYVCYSVPLANVGYWREELPDAEIERFYHENNLSPDYVPEFYWPCDDGIGRGLRDISGNNQTGTLRNEGSNPYYDTDGVSWALPKTVDLGTQWTADDNCGSFLFPLVAGDNILVTASTLSKNMRLPADGEAYVGMRFRAQGANGAALVFETQADCQIVEGAGGTVGTDAGTIGTSGRLTVGKYGFAELVCVDATSGAVKYAVVNASPDRAYT